MSRWTQKLLVTVWAAAIVAAGCGGDDPAPPTTAAATALPATGFGPPITAADVTASLPATRDGRRLWPEGAWGGRIIFSAEQKVPLVPGEPVGQGPNRYDQQFLVWDAGANTFQVLWTNESGRAEGVFNTDGDWALSEVSKYNPLSQWELRLHNMTTGELRTIDAEDPSTRGKSPLALLASRVVAGRVLWVNAVLKDGQRVEELRMYTIASGATTVVDSAAGLLALYPGGVAGDTVTYLRRPPGGVLAVVLRSLSRGTEREVAAPPGTIWEAISPDAKFAVARQDPALPIGATTGARFAVNLETNEARRFADGQSYDFGIDFADGYISWQVEANSPAVSGFFSLNSGISRILAPSIPVDGQGARVFDGWFFWRERSPGATAADNDRANGTLRFMRLP